ncbi:SNF1-interacting protein [Pichia californica]|nr:SNF1-interacting protein [[Candida] californica]
MEKIKPIESIQSTKSTSDYVAERLVRLVSVGLKEATMDSPSFRASLNFMHISILKCSHQIEKSIGILQKYSIAWNNFSQVKIELENLFDPYINDNQFISNDISKPCIKKYIEGQKLIFETSLMLLKIDNNQYSSIEQILTIEIPNYLEIRRNFEKIQNKYDVISAKFMQLPKNYDPINTREDSLQLFEIRKQYIHISMNLWICIKQLESKISKSVTDFSNSFWNSFDNRNLNYGSKLSNAIGLTNLVEEIKQLNKSADLKYSSSILLLKDLNRAKINSEDGAIKMYTPSLNINDFDSTNLINENLYLENEKNLNEKHGWVFFKSNKLNGNKGEVWIKRWLFVKNGVFGFLSISQDGQYVQESDKIGVLLANIKYYPLEDRKFCFQINSKLTNLIIQVETLIELKSWLTVFANVTKISINEKLDCASNRFSPCLNILKLVPIVSKDLELIDVIKIDPKIEKTSNLIELQLSNFKFNLSINPPLKTSMTEKISMSHLYLSSSTIPSATTANFWGYVNWGLYFVLDDEIKEIILKNNKNLSPKSLINLRYPDFYPENLRVADAELRSIFEICINDNELTLLRFNASWSPNSQQNIFCALYITTNSFYVYSHTCGLISILPIPLTNFLDTDIIEKSNGDSILKIYFISGMTIKMQLYDDDIYSIKSQFNFILESLKSLNLNLNSNSNDLQFILSSLINIKQLYKKMRIEKYNNDSNTNSNNSSNSNSNNLSLNSKNLNKLRGIKLEYPTGEVLNKNKNNDNNSNILTTTTTTNGISDIDSENKINYTPEMGLLLIKKVEIPSKALFHILFGDESFLLQCTLPLSSSIFKEVNSKHSLWRCDSKQKLTRVVWNPVFKVPCAKQSIERIVNNKYYNILQETPYLRFVFGINRKIFMRFVIYNLDSRSCKLMVYYSLGNGNNMLNWFSRKVIHQIMIFRMEALENRINEAVKLLGNDNRKIAFAIKTYGSITKYDSNLATKDELSFDDSISFIPLQLFSSFYYEKMNFEIERMIFKLIKMITIIIKSIIKYFNMNMILVFLFGFSILFNIILIGRTSKSYFRERNIDKHMKSLIGDHYLMERSISINEINEMINPNSTNLSFLNYGSDCYWKFLENENLNCINKYSRIEKNDELINIYELHNLEGEREISLSQKLSGLRIERNKLLTKLNLLNYIEKEFILKEWKDWISSEISNCEKVKELYPDSYLTIKDYCIETEKEMIYLYENLL